MLALSRPVHIRNSYSTSFNTPHPCGDVLSSRETKNSKHGYSIVSNAAQSKTLSIDQSARVSARNMNRYPFKHQYGWSIDNVLPPYKFATEAVLPLPQYSWKMNVFNVQEGLQKEDKFLPRGGVVPRIVDSGGDDGYPALPPDLDEEGRIKDFTATPIGGTSGGLGTKRAAAFREKDLSNQNQELKRIRQILEGSSLSRGIVTTPRSTQTLPEGEGDFNEGGGGEGGSGGNNWGNHPPPPPRPTNPLIPFLAGLAYQVLNRRPAARDHQNQNGEGDDYYDNGDEDDDNTNRQIHDQFTQSYPPSPPPPSSGNEPIITEPDDLIEEGPAQPVFQPMDHIPIIDWNSPLSTTPLIEAPASSSQSSQSSTVLVPGTQSSPSALIPYTRRQIQHQQFPQIQRSPDWNNWMNIEPRTDFGSFYHDNRFNNHLTSPATIATLIGGIGAKDHAGLSAVMTLAGGLVVAQNLAHHARHAFRSAQRALTGNSASVVGTLNDLTQLSSPFEGPVVQIDPEIPSSLPSSNIPRGGFPNNRVQRVTINNVVDTVIDLNWRNYDNLILRSQIERAEFIAQLHGSPLLQDYGDAPSNVHQYAPQRIPITPPTQDLERAGSSRAERNPYLRAMQEIREANLRLPSNYIQLSQSRILYLDSFDRQNLLNIAIPYRRVGAVFIRQDNLPARYTSPRQSRFSTNLVAYDAVQDYNTDFDASHEPVPLDTNNIRVPTLFLPAGGFMVSYDAIRNPLTQTSSAPSPEPAPTATATELRGRRRLLPQPTRRPAVPYVEVEQRPGGPRRSQRIRLNQARKRI